MLFTQSPLEIRDTLRLHLPVIIMIELISQVIDIKQMMITI